MPEQIRTAQGTLVPKRAGTPIPTQEKFKKLTASTGAGDRIFADTRFTRKPTAVHKYASFTANNRTRYRTRPLTLEMIRRLVSQLNLPAEVLIKPYALREEFLAA